MLFQGFRKLQNIICGFGLILTDPYSDCWKLDRKHINFIEIDWVKCSQVFVIQREMDQLRNLLKLLKAIVTRRKDATMTNARCCSILKLNGSSIQTTK